MDIKIKCTQQEFAQLIRECQCMSMDENCLSCILYPAGGCDGIENIAAFEIVEDGADG